MTKQEFLTELQKALTNKISAAEVNNHINYYREYIEIEVRKGIPEEQVISGLGNPRLIAKTILSAAAGDTGSGSDESSTGGYGSGEGKGFKEYLTQMPTWMWVIAVILLILLVGLFFATIIKVFWPVFIPLIVIIFLIRWWNNNK